MLVEAPSSVTTGVALGWDIAVAREAIEMGIPHRAAIPFAKQHELWSDAQKKEYEWVLSNSEVVYTSNEISYAKELMLSRNVWMVDNTSAIFAFYNYKIVSGTAHCVKYARSKGKAINNYWDLWQRIIL